MFRDLARYPRLRVTRGVDWTEAQLDVEELPPFKGDFGAVLRLCRDLDRLGCAVCVYSENARFLDGENGPFAQVPFVEVRKGALSSGFVDRAAKRAFISDRELSGVSTKASSSEWRAPLEW